MAVGTYVVNDQTVLVIPEGYRLPIVDRYKAFIILETLGGSTYRVYKAKANLVPGTTLVVDNLPARLHEWTTPHPVLRVGIQPRSRA